MRVFVTGATGFIGSAVVQDLLDAGHQVLGLARSDVSAEALGRLGVEAHRGELSDLDGLSAAAKACDGVIHTAFIHDFSHYLANIETDRRAVEALITALEGSDKPLAIASGTMMVAAHSPATEESAPPSPATGRGVAEEMVVASASRGVRGAVVRLPPTVHGAGDQGFVPRLVAAARAKGVSPYLGDGANRWPAVHRLDAARVFRLAIERATPGARLHAVAEDGVPMRAIAEAIGEGLGVPARSISADAAPAHFDFLAMFVGADNLTSSTITRHALGWTPQGPDLITDMRENGYYA